MAQIQPTKTVFYQAFPDSAAQVEEAVYRVVRTEVSGQNRLDSLFYTNSKRLVHVRSTTWQSAGDTLVTTTQWRANGKKAGETTSLGKRSEHTTYDEEGHISQKSVWERGKKIAAVCYSDTGALIPCSEYQYVEKMPEYPGGPQALLQYIGSSIQYPKSALKRRQKGVVIITFVVDETGQVRYTRVKKGISPELDAEALRVISGLAKFEPGQQNGETVPVHYTVPVTFAIK
ncbi:energy transducer TonB [Hymenobacter fodinae]|uniref:Energy transducer TonB n=1 Tax=Hymenobacter fodinae TaxID=2510796 RepID=A0A4Z0P3S0_9BACT|nr:energy transducer TonB [Hymenobacter fodinae]TGE04848.1 energy transducer TonB [Hymenobacter fodinae]